MERICVIGPCGAGKSTFAAALARRQDLPHVELDSIYHQPDWTVLPEPDFRAEVERRTEGARWIVDGNYTTLTQDITWDRADTIVWLEMPRRLVMRRVIWRTLRRVISRKKLWNDNRERWQNLFSLDPARSIIAWAWTEYGKYSERYERAMHDPRWSHADFVRLQTPREVTRFLNEARS